MLDKLSRKFTDIIRQISGQAHISEKNIEDALREIKVALLEADVNLRVVRRFINHATEEALGETVLRSVSPGQQFIKMLYDRMVQLLGDSHQDLKLKGPDAQSVILLLGLQGSGKTTTAAKLARLLKSRGRRPLLVAADLRRPAAAEQLAVLAGQAEVSIHREEGGDPVRVVRNALHRASREQLDTVIIDTSGRLQIDDDLMREVEEIKKAARPDELLLVADAMTGQNAVEIASAFNERLGLTGVILSKFDSDARGGAALSIKSVTGQPIKFIGTAEKLEGLEPFHPDRIASRILGMGDVVTLVERAQETIEEEEAEELRRRIESETFTLEDYLDQFKRLRKMGNLQSVLEMIPGAGAALDENSIDEDEMKREEAIVLSMTPGERRNHRIIGPSRRSRIARGSGTSVFRVNQLLKKFEKTRLMMKKMSKNKKYQQAMMTRLGNAPKYPNAGQGGR
jgi:signal recognition particle subunit SRP54